MSTITTYEQSREQIARLVAHFVANRPAYTAPTYKEAHARQEWIDPLFAALGWDVANAEHVAPQYREVTPEDSLRIEGQKKAPDYAFRVGEVRKFFAEAKKPGLALKTAAAAAYQLRRYAWTAALPLSLLTDFDELAVYDCRARPKSTDKPTVARTAYYTCEEYADRWREVWDIFSREAVYQGSFEQYAQQAGKGKRGTSTVDAEFLKEIEGWRETLARNLALRNTLDLDALNDAVQSLIDRIIFLRMAEDRGIEPPESLKGIAASADPYAAFMDLCRRADAKYNSGLFDFSPGGDVRAATLTVDDKVLRTILQSLYFPECPYEFSVLPVEVLGNVYEQFLGKVIRLTPGGRAKVEEKPEVRHAGGVYYTPQFVCDFLVERAVGAQIEGKGPKQLVGFRVLDLACGSGSFLLSAYKCLLRHYQHWYETHDPMRFPKAIQARGDAWALTTAERKRILTAHIFGVDIDRAAVETSKLSLLLQVLEGESSESIGRQLALFHERALPDLARNVKCGNSLVGPDYFAGTLLPDDEELRQINPFDWAREFPEAMEAGGFDCIIGNPPYIRQELFSPLKPYLKDTYPAIYHSTADLFVYFIGRGVALLRPGGRLAYIASNSWLKANYAGPLRTFLRTQATVEEIVDLGDNRVFADAPDVYPAILTVRKREPIQTDTARVAVFERSASLFPFAERVAAKTFAVSIHDQPDQGWQLADQSARALVQKILAAGQPLGQLVNGQICRGVLTGLNDAFIVDRATRDRLVREDRRCAALLRPLVNGEDVRPAYTEDEGRFLIAVTNGLTREQSGQTFGTEAAAWRWFTREYPALAAHLAPFAEPARVRTDQGEWWWELRACAYWADFAKAKIFWPEMSKYPRFALAAPGIVGNKTTFMIPGDDYSLLGILMSRALWFAVTGICQPIGERGGILRYMLSAQYMERLPIPAMADDQRRTIARLAEELSNRSQQRYALHCRVRERALTEWGQASGARLNQKLTAWWTLTYPEFCNQANRVLGATLSPQDHHRRLWFEQQRAAESDLAAQITRLASDLDTQVYALFDLTAAEIDTIMERTRYNYAEV